MVNEVLPKGQGPVTNFAQEGATRRIPLSDPDETPKVLPMGHVIAATPPPGSLIAPFAGMPGHRALRAFRTKSWLAVAGGGVGTQLWFGSVIVPKTGAGRPAPGPFVTALIGPHRVYSRALLAAAARRLAKAP
jgi:hypothetical protein